MIWSIRAIGNDAAGEDSYRFTSADSSCEGPSGRDLSNDGELRVHPCRICRADGIAIHR